MISKAVELTRLALETSGKLSQLRLLHGATVAGRLPQDQRVKRLFAPSLRAMYRASNGSRNIFVTFFRWSSRLPQKCCRSPFSNFGCRSCFRNYYCSFVVDLSRGKSIARSVHGGLMEILTFSSLRRFPILYRLLLLFFFTFNLSHASSPLASDNASAG